MEPRRNDENTGQAPLKSIDLVFSDIDGTCVHYDLKASYSMSDTFDDLTGFLGAEHAVFKDGRHAEVIRLPTSSSGSTGAISLASLKLYAALRNQGRKRLVLISGCRMSTMMQRLPYLPKADAYVCESGGRIFYDAAEPHITACGLVEDVEWRNSHQSLPPMQSGDICPRDYPGSLWEFFRELSKKGIQIDSKNYTTAFRIKDERVSPEDVPPSLACSTNLGHLDVYPKSSGKLNAAKYSMEKFGSPSDGSGAIFLCGAVCIVYWKLE